MATRKKPAPNNSAPVATKKQAGVSAAAGETSSAAASTEPVTQADPIVDTQGASPSEPGESIQVDGQGLAPISAATALRVTARVDGFRRCGRAWSASGDTVHKSDFSAEQLEILKNEPGLVVTEVFE